MAIAAIGDKEAKVCGRYSRAADMATLAKRFGIELAEFIDVRPRYNLAPSEDAPTVVMEGGGNACRS
jgi:putative SOS response-associated peptidase YedK